MLCSTIHTTLYLPIQLTGPSVPEDIVAADGWKSLRTIFSLPKLELLDSGQWGTDVGKKARVKLSST